VQAVEENLEIHFGQFFSVFFLLEKKHWKKQKIFASLDDGFCGNSRKNRKSFAGLQYFVHIVSRIPS